MHLTTMTISEEQVQPATARTANESPLNKQVEHTGSHAHNVHERRVIMMFFVEFLG